MSKCIDCKYRDYDWCIVEPVTVYIGDRDYACKYFEEKA